MKICHAAPLLLTGWSLTVPPDSTVPYSVDPAAPSPVGGILLNLTTRLIAKVRSQPFRPGIPISR
jgi:hypothetical protein